MNYNKSFFGLVLALLVLLPGCILHVPSYRRQKLRLVRDNFTYTASEKNITVHAKVLTEIDKGDLFGEHIGALAGKEYKIIYLSIHNLSDKNYIFRPQSIGLKQLSSRDVIKAMKKTSSVGRLALYAGASINPLFFMNPHSAAIVPVAMCVLPVFVIASWIGLIQGVKSIVMNTRVRKDIEEKVFPKKMVIASGDYGDGLIFVKSSDYKPQFTVMMYEQNKFDERVVFDVDVSKNE